MFGFAERKNACFTRSPLVANRPASFLTSHDALELSRRMAIQNVAEHRKIRWGTIKAIQSKYLRRCCANPKLNKLKQIAIDEIHIGTGHQFLTIVLNLFSGTVVFVGDGKGGEALEIFWKRVPRVRAKIQAVGADISAAYIHAVRDNIPATVHLCDHFPVIKLFNDRLSTFRRQLYREASTDRIRRILSRFHSRPILIRCLFFDPATARIPAKSFPSHEAHPLCLRHRLVDQSRNQSSCCRAAEKHGRAANRRWPQRLAVVAWSGSQRHCRRQAKAAAQVERYGERAVESASAGPRAWVADRGGGPDLFGDGRSEGRDAIGALL
ncbi:MAG: hypothetical protein EXR98_15435 [Gemmataceae bacterium]|nr:hypothetical protein [Gemmataceae bacterium]